MTIRLGANPIGWSNDDLQEIGGDTPLETCLAEAREAGFEGMEKGNKMPNDGAALKAKLAEFGLVFVGGWYSTELAARSAREEFEAAKAHIAMTKGAGANILIAAETSNTIHGDRAAPLSTAPAHGQGRLGGFGAKMTEFAKPRRRRGPEALLSPPHGHDRPVGGRHRRLHGSIPRRRCICCSTPATRPGAARTRPRSRARYRDRIGHVHCKDVRKAKMDEPPTPAT